MESEQERFEQFMAIIRRGGTVVMHPDTFAELKAKAPAPVLWPFLCAGMANQVMATEYVKPGQIFAVENREFKFSDFNFSALP